MVLVFVRVVLVICAGSVFVVTLKNWKKMSTFILFRFNPRQDWCGIFYNLEITNLSLCVFVDLLGSQQRDHCSTSKDLVMFPFSLLAYLTLMLKVE